MEKGIVEENSYSKELSFNGGAVIIGSIIDGVYNDFN